MHMHMYAQLAGGRKGVLVSTGINLMYQLSFGYAKTVQTSVY